MKKGRFLWSAHRITEKQKAGKAGNIKEKQLKNSRKEDLRLAAGLTTNQIANMGKGLHISMETLLRICGALDCDISDVIELEREKSSSGEAEDRIKKSKIPC